MRLPTARPATFASATVGSNRRASANGPLRNQSPGKPNVGPSALCLSLIPNLGLRPRLVYCAPLALGYGTDKPVPLSETTEILTRGQNDDPGSMTIQVQWISAENRSRRAWRRILPLGFWGRSPGSRIQIRRGAL